MTRQPFVHGICGGCLGTCVSGDTMLHLLQGMTLLATEGPSQHGSPVLYLFSRGCIGVDSPGGACSRHRLHMQLRMPAPAFYGAMNFSGDLRAWSFTDFTWPDQEHEVSRIVRFAGSDGSELWNFWVMLIYSTSSLHTRHIDSSIALDAMSLGSKSLQQCSFMQQQDLTAAMPKQ